MSTNRTFRCQPLRPEYSRQSVYHENSVLYVMPVFQFCLHISVFLCRIVYMTFAMFDVPHLFE